MATWLYGLQSKKWWRVEISKVLCEGSGFFSYMADAMKAKWWLWTCFAIFYLFPLWLEAQFRTFQPFIPFIQHTGKIKARCWNASTYLEFGFRDFGKAFWGKSHFSKMPEFHANTSNFLSIPAKIVCSNRKGEAGCSAHWVSTKYDSPSIKQSWNLHHFHEIAFVKPEKKRIFQTRQVPWFR